ncbi:MAG: hypothetical protein ACKV2V_28170, partial [Blastocatellia bacterium]
LPDGRASVTCGFLPGNLNIQAMLKNYLKIVCCGRSPAFRRLSPRVLASAQMTGSRKLAQATA